MRRRPRASASLCCKRPAHAKSSRFGNEDRFDSDPRDGPGIVAGDRVTGVHGPRHFYPQSTQA